MNTTNTKYSGGRVWCWSYECLVNGWNISTILLEIIGWRVDEDANGENIVWYTYGDDADVLSTAQFDGIYVEGRMK